MTKTKTKAAD